MGFLSKAFKSIGKAIIAPSKWVFRGAYKLARGAWKGVEKVMASKAFKIGMLIMSVVTAVSGLAIATAADRLFDFEFGVAAGALAGGLTSTPTLTPRGVR